MKKKLQLNSQVIRTLVPANLELVAGGAQGDRTQSGINCPLVAPRNKG